MGKVIDVHVHVGSSADLYVGGSIQIVTSRMSRHASRIPSYPQFPALRTRRESSL